MEPMLGDPSRADKMPPGWRGPGLCLKPCLVYSPDHPGLCLGSAENPVCALPKGHPEGQPCMCFPADRNRYALCPSCKALISKRVIAKHIPACYGPGTNDPKVREMKERLAYAAYLDERAKEFANWKPDPAWVAEEAAMKAKNRADGLPVGYTGLTYSQVACGNCIELVQHEARHVYRALPCIAQDLRNGRRALRGKAMDDLLNYWNAKIAKLRHAPLSDDFRAITKKEA